MGTGEGLILAWKHDAFVTLDLLLSGCVCFPIPATDIHGGCD